MTPLRDQQKMSSRIKGKRKGEDRRRVMKREQERWEGKERRWERRKNKAVRREHPPKNKTLK